MERTVKLRKWLADNAVGLASLAVSACGVASSVVCGIGLAFSERPAQMTVYTAALLSAGVAAGWAARSVKGRSARRIAKLSPAEAIAAYELLTMGDPRPVGRHLDAVVMSLRHGRGVFECSMDGEILPSAIYSLTPSWRVFLKDHLDELGAAAGRPHRDPA